MIKILSINLNRETDILSIHVAVEDKPYFRNIFIDKIIIDTNMTFSPTGPSEDAVYTFISETDSKELTIEVPNMAVSGGLYGKLLFIYAIAKGVPNIETPCGEDNPVDMRIAADYCSFYNKMMPYIKELSNTCKVPREFIDSYLKFKAIQVAVYTQNYQEACQFWNQFYSCQPSNITINQCGCHG